MIEEYVFVLSKERKQSIGPNSTYLCHETIYIKLKKLIELHYTISMGTIFIHKNIKLTGAIKPPIQGAGFSMDGGRKGSGGGTC